MATNKTLLKFASIAALVPLSLAGLSACAAPEKEDKPRSEKKKKPKKTQNEGGGGLPFGNQGDPEPTNNGSGNNPYGTDDATPPATYGNSGGGGGNGSDKVSFGSTNLSNIDWQVTCYKGESPLISATDSSAKLGDLDAPMVSLYFDKDKVSSVMISAGGSSAPALYYSSYSDKDNATGSFDGNKVTVNGKGTVDFQDEADFEIVLTCDSTF